MNVIKIDLGKDYQYVNLYPVGDAHAGSGHFDKKGFEEHINMIKNDDNAVCILNGDLINNAIKTSVSDIYDENMMPEEACDYLVNILSPIKEKIIGINTGNHENRTYKLTGIDIMKNVAYRLNISDYYSAISNVIFLSFGKSRGRENVRNTFSIYHTHGHGGGRTVGGKANALRRMSEVVHADIYIHSHTHSPIIFKENYILTNNSNKGIKEVARLFVNTNAYEGFGGYGETMKLPPSNREPIVVTLTADDRGNKIMKGSL